MTSDLAQAPAVSPTGGRELIPTATQQAAQMLAPRLSPWLGSANPLQEYWVDAWQRWVLTLDVLRQRGNSYLEQKERISPVVLNFGFEVVLDGRAFERPVNYVLARI